MPLSSVVGAQSIVKPGVCTSTTKPASPFDGQMIYMTDVDQSAVWDGSAWVGLDPSRDRNVIINGAMQVAQRGTSATGNTTGNYRTADRFVTDIVNAGTWTETIENDAPTGSGFRKSLKMLCTTADTSLATTDRLIVQQQIEGQNLQHFLNGTSSAKPFSLSFWVKSNVTGTYIVELEDWDGSKQVSASYTVSSSATWEKKTVTFPANTVNTFDNNNEKSLGLYFWLAAGPSFTSGTLQTTWGTTTANRVVGQTNLASATNNYWQVTGVQLEAGAVATPFEFEDYGTTFMKCCRYYYQTPDIMYINHTPTLGNSYSSRIFFPVVTRSASPTVTVYAGANSTGTVNKWTAYNSTGGQGEQTITIEAAKADGFQALFVGNATYTLSTGSYKVSNEL